MDLASSQTSGRGDPDEFRSDFVAWVAERDRTHLPFLVEVEGCRGGDGLAGHH